MDLSYRLELVDIGDRKIGVISQLMEIRPDLGLAGAKTLVEITQYDKKRTTLRDDVSQHYGTILVQKFEDTGATVELVENA